MIPPIRPFKPSYDRTPKYSVKEVSEMTGLSSYTIRYYDNAGLIPGLERTEGNARLFSDYAVSWLHLVHCLRTTGLPVEQVRHYIRLCQKGGLHHPRARRNDLPAEKSAPAADQGAAAADGGPEVQGELLQGEDQKSGKRLLQSAHPCHRAGACRHAGISDLQINW